MTFLAVSNNPARRRFFRGLTQLEEDGVLDRHRLPKPLEILRRLLEELERSFPLSPCTPETSDGKRRALAGFEAPSPTQYRWTWSPETSFPEMDRAISALVDSWVVETRLGNVPGVELESDLTLRYWLEVWRERGKGEALRSGWLCVEAESEDGVEAGGMVWRHPRCVTIHPPRLEPLKVEEGQSAAPILNRLTAEFRRRLEDELRRNSVTEFPVAADPTDEQDPEVEGFKALAVWELSGREKSLRWMTEFLFFGENYERDHNKLARLIKKARTALNAEFRPLETWPLEPPF